MKMKKIFTGAVTIALATALTACGGGGSSSSSGGGQSYETTTTAATTPAKQTVSSMTYNFDGDVGTYSGEVNSDGIPDGEGTWILEEAGDKIILKGIWVGGGINTGTLEVIYRNETMGKADIIDGQYDQEDMQRISDNMESADSQAEFEADVEALEGIIGFIGYLDENFN